MEGKSSNKVPLHTSKLSGCTGLNRVFAIAYACGILALLYHHVVTLLFHCTTLVSLTIHVSMLISDLILGFMWSAATASRIRPIYRQEFPENLRQVMRTEKDFPALDIFICTADPYKEPPMNVANTALSVMAYDYPPEKLSIYVSDDGGSELTLMAFIEAAKFGTHWLPFCRMNNIMERCPDAYFRSNYSASTQAQNIKRMYESMKAKVENVVERGKVGDEYISSEQQRQAFNKWTKDFTPQRHPTVIQVLLETGKNKDITGHPMPNLIYVSRQKSPASPHHFKAGALNALLRVSAVLTNAPIFLTLDCDMYSNDPQTPHRMLCYFMDPAMKPRLGYVQFPQYFNGLCRDDIYACEIKWLFQINPLGFDGLAGPNHVGTNCFFSRRAFFGGPSSFVTPEVPELCPDHVVDKPIDDQEIIALAHRVASCDYEDNTNWGCQIGFRYGSLVEDYYTGYRLQCEGWRSVFCNPEREAFIGDAPSSLIDMLSQSKRWSVGLLQVALSKNSPLTFGTRALGPLMALCYAMYAFWPFWSIPITTYAFLPQLALLNGLTIFPRVSDRWFWLYAFLFLGAYGQDCLNFVAAKGSLRRWWNDQRIWLTRGVSSHVFGLAEFIAKGMGIATHGFNVTSKVVDDEQGKRYEQGMFEFGVASPMFVPMAVAAIINLAAFLAGLRQVLMGRDVDGLFVQMFIAGFAVVNCWPVYEAMLLRTDKGRMATKTTLISTFLAWALYKIVSFTPRP